MAQTENRRDVLALVLGLCGLAVAALFVERYLLLVRRAWGPGDVGRAIVFLLAALAQSLPMIGVPLFLWSRLRARPVQALRLDWARPFALFAGGLVAALLVVAALFGLQVGSLAALGLVGVLVGLGFPLLVASAFFPALARPEAEMRTLWAFVSSLVVIGGALAAAML